MTPSKYTPPIIVYMTWHPVAFAVRLIVPVLGVVWWLAGVLP